MSQIFHILRKDVRHLWIEIAGSLAIFVLYVWHTLDRWGGRYLDVRFTDSVWKVVIVLVPVSWSLLIIRSIQDESLVGDRQFWTTRPYDWRKLAVEKLLLALLFVHVPVFVVQVIFLNDSGFPAVHYIPGMLRQQLMLFIFLDLTSALIASVTSSIVQVLVWIVGIVLYIAGMAMLSDYLPGGNMPTATDAGNDATAIAVVVFMLGIILFQFVRRTTWIARVVIIGAVLMTTLLIGAMPYVSDVASGYPPRASGEASPVTIQLLNPPPPPKADARNGGFEIRTNTNSLSFPMMASEVEQGTMSVMAGWQVTVEAPNGKRWSSRWRGDSYAFWPGETPSSLGVEIDPKFFEQFRDTPVKVHFSFAITGYREINLRQITAQEGRFSVPGVGMCWTKVDYPSGDAANWIECMAPIQQPPLMGWFDSSASTCRPRHNDDPDLHETLYLWANDDNPPVQIVPVSFFRMYFAALNQERDPTMRPLGICAGTPFTLATPETFQHLRVEAELDGVKLSDYRRDFLYRASE